MIFLLLAWIKRQEPGATRVNDLTLMAMGHNLSDWKLSRNRRKFTLLKSWKSVIQNFLRPNNKEVATAFLGILVEFIQDGLRDKQSSASPWRKANCNGEDGLSEGDMWARKHSNWVALDCQCNSHFFLWHILFLQYVTLLPVTPYGALAELDIAAIFTKAETMRVTKPAARWLRPRTLG